MNDVRYEVFTQPSVTIPNRVRPLKELLSRLATGNMVDGHTGVYDEDPSMAGIERMSKVELAQLSIDAKASVEDKRRLLRESAEQRSKAAADKAAAAITASRVEPIVSQSKDDDNA